MTRRFTLALVLVLALAACGTEQTSRTTNQTSATTTPAASTAPPSVAVNVPATQTRAIELTQVAAALAPTATSVATPTTVATATATRPAPTNTPLRPTATATPGRVELTTQNVSSSRNSIGSLYFIGEVVNTGGTAATNIQIAVSLLNDAGQVAASGQASTIGVSILKVGEKTVWEALIQNAPETWKEERIQVQAGPVTAAFRNIYAEGLTVEGVTANPPANQFASATVAGQVKNGGTVPAKFVIITVAGYDAAGKLVMVEIATTDLQEIAPGSVAPFSTTLLGLKEAPPVIETYVRGSR